MISRRDGRGRLWRWGCGLLLALLLADYVLYPRLSPIGGRSVNRGENGLWLRYRWYFGERSNAEVRTLARQLTELGEVDLANAAVRRRMVVEARWLVTECGFDGVQWDYEICEESDPHFLALLRETRASLPQGKLLSAAVPIWLPAAFRRCGWSEAYFARVAAACDQMAVMCYDTGIYMPRGYVWLVYQQAVHVTRAVAQGNPHCRVLLGLPTYAKGGLSHHAYAENLRLALKGVREGLADPRANLSAFAGVAPFADYTTQPEEWRTYRTLWLDSSQAGESGMLSRPGSRGPGKGRTAGR